MEHRAPVGLAVRKIDPGSASRGLLSAATHQAEARLLADAADGSQSAFRVLVGRHLPGLVGLARRMLGDAMEAEDIAQEALLRLWRDARSIEIGDVGVKPWLSRVAANLCLDRLRARRRLADTRGVIPEQAAAADQHRLVEEQALSNRVDRALQALPERQRLAIVLFHHQGLSQNEAAAILDVSADALESLLARARRTLKVALRDEWRGLLPEPDDPVVEPGWKTRHDGEA